MSRRGAEVEPTTDPSAVVGPRIRELRRARGMTLQELGARSGLTHAFLSQVERGLTRPSLRSTARIASALGVPVGSLVEAPAPTGSPLVTRASVAPAIGEDGPNGTASVRALTGDGHVLQGTLSQGVLPPTQTLGHAGEELVHVISGSLAVTVREEVFVLGPGDTIVFDGRDPHVYESVGPEPPTILIVVANAERALPREIFGRVDGTTAAS